MNFDYVIQKSRYGKSNKIRIAIMRNSEKGFCIDHHIKPSKIYVTKHISKGHSITKSVYLSWHKNGLLHRESLPAKINYSYMKYLDSNGNVFQITGQIYATFCKNGLTHREDGPAFFKDSFCFQNENCEQTLKQYLKLIFNGHINKGHWFLFNKRITNDNLKNLKKALKNGKQEEFIGLLQLSDLESFSQLQDAEKENPYEGFSIEQRDGKLIINNYYSKF